MKPCSLGMRMRQSTIPNKKKKKKLTKSKGEICCNDQNYTFFKDLVQVSRYESCDVLTTSRLSAALLTFSFTVCFPHVI
jgi:hypothetical protein